MIYNNTGYVKLHRKLFDWEWWDDINTFRLFITILLMANWKDKQWRGRVIPRGSCWTSLGALSEKSGLTMRQTRIALNKLILTGEVTSEATNEGRLVTVANYDVYQLDNENAANETSNETAEKRQTNDKRNGKRAATTKEHIRNKEQKELKELQRRAAGIDINELLSVEDIAELGSVFENVNDLLDEVETDINVKGKTVNYPLRYVYGYARNKEWPRK